MAGSVALRNRGGFGGKSHSIISLVFGSWDTSCIKFTPIFELTEGKTSEERVVSLDRFLHIGRHARLPGILPELERHMEIECR